MVERKSRGIRISDPVYDAFSSVYEGSISTKVEELMLEHLGLGMDSMNEELLSLKAKAIKLNNEIAERENAIRKTENVLKDRLGSIWKDFRKGFNNKMDEWEGDTDMVISLKVNHQIILTYDGLYNIWDEMEGIE